MVRAAKYEFERIRRALMSPEGDISPFDESISDAAKRIIHLPGCGQIKIIPERGGITIWSSRMRWRGA